MQKINLSKLVRDAREIGPQTITVRGKRTAVLLSAEAYDSLAAAKPTFVDALLSEPAWDDDFVEAINARSKDPGRDIDL